MKNEGCQEEMGSHRVGLVDGLACGVEHVLVLPELLQRTPPVGSCRRGRWDCWGQWDTRRGHDGASGGWSGSGGRGRGRGGSAGRAEGCCDLCREIGRGADAATKKGKLLETQEVEGLSIRWRKRSGGGRVNREKRTRVWKGIAKEGEERRN